MVERPGIAGPVILLADRNYEAYTQLCVSGTEGLEIFDPPHKDRDQKNAYGIKLPDHPEFDLPVHMTLRRLTPRQLKQRGLPAPERYYQAPSSVTFDFFDLERDFYTVSAGIVCLKLKNGNTQMLITNLDPAEFPLPALQVLYAKRWGIETSFRELKYTVGLIHLHSRKSGLVLQEIFAAFTFFNFTQAAAWNVDKE